MISSILGLPPAADRIVLRLERREVAVTNLGKLFWPDLGITKGTYGEPVTKSCWTSFDPA